MQATVHDFDAQSLTGSVICDDGVLVPFDTDAFNTSGLLHVRLGQRLTVQIEGSHVTSMRINGIEPVQSPH